MMSALSKIFLLDTDFYFLWWRLASPFYLLFLLVIPYLCWLYYKTGGVTGPLLYSDIRRITRALGVPDRSAQKIPARHGARRFLFWIRTACIFLVILALARPQAERVTEEIITHGVDILLAIDISGSMTLIDQPFGGEATRLDVTKKVVKDFVAGRQHDPHRIGRLRGRSLYPQPADGRLRHVDGFLGQDGIWRCHRGRDRGRRRCRYRALASAAHRGQEQGHGADYGWRKQPRRNHAESGGGYGGVPWGSRFTASAWEATARFSGAFRDCSARRCNRFAARSWMKRRCGAWRETTGGQYFRALDEQGLTQIFEEISSLEKSEIESRGHRRFRELFPYLLVPALALFLLEIILANTRLRKLP